MDEPFKESKMLTIIWVFIMFSSINSFLYVRRSTQLFLLLSSIIDHNNKRIYYGNGITREEILKQATATVRGMKKFNYLKFWKSIKDYYTDEEWLTMTGGRKMKPYYITFDTELSSLDLDNSLLTAYFVILNENLEIEKELDLRLMPNDNWYRFSPSAMAVNKIDLVELAKTAVTYKEGGTLLFDFIARAYKQVGEQPNFSGFPNELKLIPFGQGIISDTRQLTTNLINRGTWDNYVSYRTIELSSLTQVLKIKKRLPEDLSGGLESMVEYFRIKIEGNAHEAKTDTYANIEVFKKLMELI